MHRVSYLPDSRRVNVFAMKILRITLFYFLFMNNTRKIDEREGGKEEVAKPQIKDWQIFLQFQYLFFLIKITLRIFGKL